MAAPALPPTFVLTALTDYNSVITLRHPGVTAVPGLKGYKYFVDLSLAGVLAKANADIAADAAARLANPPPTPPLTAPVPLGLGGLAANPAVLTDLASDLVGFGAATYGSADLMVQVSREALAGEITFPFVAGIPAVPTTYYFAVVAWNEDGASTVVTSSVVHRDTSNPVVISITARETQIDIQFDQPVRSPTGRDGEGFQFEVNGAVRFADDAAFVPGNPDILRFTMGGVIEDGDTVTVTYDQTKGDLTNTPGTLVLLTFTPIFTENQSVHASLAGVVAALDKRFPEKITLLFSRKVTSTNYLTGVSFNANGVEVVPVSAALSGDPRDLEVVFPNAFSSIDVIEMSYNAAVGDWQSDGYPISSIVEREVTNASRIGTVDSAYPLSSVVREPLAAKGGDIIGTVGIDLNFVDRELVDRYGPARVDFGGTFGVTPENPQGVFVPQDLQELNTGMEVSKTFTVPRHPEQAQVAGNEWLQVITERVGIALGILRTMDRNVVLGDRTVRQV